MSDLTRFDFYAKRFYFSENVRLMSAEEVGQYLLLLVEAWMGGKDASLPDNPALLARYARAEHVSETVLGMFPVVQTEAGTRRRNPTLYAEWEKANQRSEAARTKAEQRWGTAVEEEPRKPGFIAALPQQSHGITTANAQDQDQDQSQDQAGSGSARPGTSSHPSQTTPSGEYGVDSPLGAAAPDPARSTPDFKTFRSVWRKLVDVKGTPWTQLGGNKNTQRAYYDACAVHGPSQVLDAIALWATKEKIDWLISQNFRNPFASFLKHLPELVEELQTDPERDPAMTEADQIAEATPPLIKTPEQMNAVEFSIQQQARDEQAARDARAAKFGKPEETQAVNPLDYL